MQRNISTIWWRFGGFVMGLVGAIAWTHDVAAYNEEGYYPNGYSYKIYDLYGDGHIDTDYYTCYQSCNIDNGYELCIDTKQVYGNTTNLLDSSTVPWWCGARTMETKSDEIIASYLGDDWNALVGTTEDVSDKYLDDGVYVKRARKYLSRDVVYGPSTSYGISSQGDVGYVMADYGYTYTVLYRIVGCGSGYTLTGASVDDYVESLSGISCVADSGGGTTVVPTTCPGIPNDDNKLMLYDRGDQGCFFWEADTATHNLYDATGKFMYTTSCSCWDDGSRMCS